VVTASDTYSADIAISGGTINAIGQNLPRENATRILDAKNKYVMPDGIDVHTHLDMPFGGTTSADDFETGTRAAAFGGTTTLIDFAIQYKGQPLRAAFDAWMEKAAFKATSDYGFHCIITDLPNARLDEMGELVREGVPSFKLFMAYPGVFMLDDATIFKAMRTASKIGGMICMHAENGGAIDVIVQQALAKARPRGITRLRVLQQRGEAASRAPPHWRRRPDLRWRIVHLGCNDALEKVRRPATRTCASTPRPVRSTLSLARRYGQTRFLNPPNTFSLTAAEKWHRKNSGPD
jgi:dihydropyrimidinase